MISDQSSSRAEYDLPSPTSLPQTASAARDTKLQNSFLYQHQEQNAPNYHCEQSPPCRKASFDPKRSNNYSLATVISPPRQQHIRTLEFSPVSSHLPSSSHTPPCSGYSTNCSPHQNQLFQHRTDQTVDSSHQKYSLQSSCYQEFQDNHEHFLSTAANVLNTNTTCLSLLEFQTLPFDTDINNNNHSDLNECLDNSFFDSLQIANDNHGKITRLPPFSALLSTSSVKQSVLESSQQIMRTQDNMFDDNSQDDARLSSSFSSVEEETHYTDLTNVGQTHEQDLSSMDDTPEINSYLDWSYDPDYIPKTESSEPYDPVIFNLDPNIPFPDTCDEMNLDSSSPDSSDGYDSNSSPFNQCISIENSAEITSHIYRADTGVPYGHLGYGGHESSSSDEGYGEGHDLEDILPIFEKIQTRTDVDKGPQRKRRNLISTEKKKTVRESLQYVEKVRQKPGRKPGQVSNVLHLWEFMRDLLHGSENHGIIEWISKTDGVFKVINSTEVARLWGEKKKNKKKMTYEKLSRSLRYSRLEGYFADLPKDKNYPKKLCFKFGPKSRNWH